MCERSSGGLDTPIFHVTALCAGVCEDLLGGHWTFSSVVVHAVVGDSSELPAAVVFIVDVVCHILQVLHVSSGDTK